MNPKSSLPEDRNPKISFVPGGMVSIMNDLHKLQDTMDRLTAENNDLKDRIRNLGVDYDYAKNAATKSNDEARAAKTQLEAKTTALVAALAKLDAANASVSKLNAIVQNEEWKQNRSVEAAEKEQKRIQDNCNHLNDIVKTQSETIKIASEKLAESNRNEDHLARKTIKLYNENQKLSDEISNLKKQIEDLKKPVEKSSVIPITPEDNIDVNKIRQEAAFQFVNLLKLKLAEFNDRPFYKRMVEAPSLLEHISTLVNNIGQDIPNAAPPHTPNTSSSK